MTDEQTISGMILIWVNQTPWRKHCPSATVCLTNPTDCPYIEPRPQQWQASEWLTYGVPRWK